MFTGRVPILTSPLLSSHDKDVGSTSVQIGLLSKKIEKLSIFSTSKLHEDNL